MTPRPIPELATAARDVLSAEHLIVYKLVAARAHDLSDMESVVIRQGTRLDLDRIRYWGREFAELKEDPDLLRPFEEAWRKARGS